MATVSRSPMGRIAGFHSPARFTFKIEHRPPPRFGSLDFSSQEMRSAPPGNPGCPRFASSPLPPYSFPTFYLAIFRLFDAGRCKVRRIGIKGQMRKDKDRYDSRSFSFVTMYKDLIVIVFYSVEIENWNGR